MITENAEARRLTAAVLIPWYERSDISFMRTRALGYVLGWWREHHPDWQVAVGRMSESEGPWCKSLAVARAAQQVDADIYVVADADVYCDRVSDAVDEVAALRCSWAVPHRLVYRMTEDATMMLLDSRRYPPLVPPGLGSPDFCEVYTGKAGGGMAVVPRLMLEEIPIDPRHIGWGQEDLSWARAMTMVAGHPWRGAVPLMHLWHEPQDRISRGVGSPDGFALWQRYQRAATRPAMLELLAEARDVLRCRMDGTAGVSAGG